MDSTFRLGALLGGSYPLSDGTPVRLRLARTADLPAIRALIGAHAGARACAEIDLPALVLFDPRRRCVLCATTLIAGRETLVGLGSIALTDDGPDVELIVADAELSDVGALLRAALVTRAVAAAHARAA